MSGRAARKSAPSIRGLAKVQGKKDASLKTVPAALAANAVSYGKSQANFCCLPHFII
jgi:hypothetical protein